MRHTKVAGWFRFLACAIVLTAGCDGGEPAASAEPKPAPEVKVIRGAETPQELAALYKEAHLEKSIEKLDLLLYSSALSEVVRDEAGNDMDRAMIRVFAYPLAAVVYEEFPPPDPYAGGEALYWWPEGTPWNRRPDGMDIFVGAVYGKLLLGCSVDKISRYAPATLDPGYIVVKFQDRYYINTNYFPILDAARGIETGTPVNYVAVPSDVGTDPYPLNLATWKPTAEDRRDWKEKMDWYRSQHEDQ